jgi:GxxExxY protein
MEMSARNIPYVREAGLPIFYKGKQIPTVYRADFLCYENVVVELKSIKKLGDNETAQILNYLKVTKSPVGLLINFGNKSLEYKRFANTKPNNLRKSA